MRAIQITEWGGPEVLKAVELPPPRPASGETLIRVSRAGINFADTHMSSNSYVRKATLPLVPGGEVAGVREDTGDRVVALTGTGGYAEWAVAPAAHTWPIPDGVTDEVALGLLIQGTTAWHLYRTAARVGVFAAGRIGECAAGRIGERAGGSVGERVAGSVGERERAGGSVGERAAGRWGEHEDGDGGDGQRGGETVVVHAAAGGVGSLAVQLGHPLGAGRVIATASSEEKRALALRLGADAAIDPAPDGLTERLLEANGGRPVDVVYEMAGGAVFDASYRALAPFGRLVVCGIASQQPNQVRSGSLLRHSRAVVGFYIFHCLERPGMWEQALDDLLARAARGELEVVVGHTYPLTEAARAHTDMRARRTTGKLLLDPTV